MHVYGRKIILPKHINVLIWVQTDQVVNDPRIVHDQVQPLPISTQYIHIH